MLRNFEKEGVSFSQSEWFLIKITQVGSPSGGSCSNTPHAWDALDYCPTGQSTDLLGDPDLSGSLTNSMAYPIDGNAASVNDICVCRLRGTFDGKTVYEFFKVGSAATFDCPHVSSVQCTGNTLVAVYNDQCVEVSTTSSTTAEPTSSTSEEPTSSSSTSEEPTSSSSTSEEPTSSSTSEEPTSSTSEEPTSSSSTSEEPTSSTSEEPTTSTEPTSSTSEEPTSSTSEEPTSSTAEPTSSTSEEPTSSTSEEPTSSTSEEPTSSTSEEPTSSTAEPTSSSTTPEPTYEIMAWGASPTGNNTNLQYYTPQIRTIDNVACNGKNVDFLSVITSDDKLYLWGNQYYGRLGNNVNINSVKSSPVQTVAGGNNWLSIQSSPWTTVAIKTDGTLWSWGWNQRGQLGDGTTTDRSSPVQIGTETTWSKIACQSEHVLALKTDGTLWSWGYNNAGQLGQNNLIYRSSPVQVGSLNTWIDIAAGAFSMGITSDGRLWTWGPNIYGNLGKNNYQSYSSPVQTIAGGTNWTQCAAGAWSAYAIKSDNTLWSWGAANYRQLGQNRATNLLSPGQVSGTNWKKVFAGNVNAAAIRTDDTLWVWGNNYYGQIGNNTQYYSPPGQWSPTQVSGAGTWLKVAVGNTMVGLKEC